MIDVLHVVRDKAAGWFTTLRRELILIVLTRRVLRGVASPAVLLDYHWNQIQQNALAQDVTVSSNGWAASKFAPERLDALGKAESAGHLFVTAPGNGAPALLQVLRRLHSSNIMVVTANDASGQLAPFSNWDPEIVDLAITHNRLKQLQ